MFLFSDDDTLCADACYHNSKYKCGEREGERIHIDIFMQGPEIPPSKQGVDSIGRGYSLLYAMFYYNVVTSYEVIMLRTSWCRSYVISFRSVNTTAIFIQFITAYSTIFKLCSCSFRKIVRSKHIQTYMHKDFGFYCHVVECSVMSS